MIEIEEIQEAPFVNEPFYECEICHEPITNPICPACLTAEINIWSAIYPNLRGRLILKLGKYLKKIGKQANETITCIKCEKGEFPICPYCFAREVLDELESLRVNKVIKKEFIRFFNYDLGHTRYF